MPDDCELAFGKGVRCSVTGDEGGFSFSTFLGVLFTVLGVAPTFVFPAGVDFVSSFLPKKDIRLFCFILEVSFVSEEDVVIVSQGTAASTTTATMGAPVSCT